MSALHRLSKEFVAAFQKADYNAAARLLPEIKLEYAKAGLLAPSSRFSKEDLLAARQLLEMGVLVRIHAGGDSGEISRLIAQVRPFYSPSLNLPKSDNETKLLALHLLLALTSNDIAKFHTELDTLDSPESDRFLRYPVLLERWLMEGAYDKAWAAVTETAQFPAPEFAILTQSLQDTIRNEIATCSEQAYESLPVANACHLLFLPGGEPDLAAFASERDWSIRAGRVWFASETAAKLQRSIEKGVAPPAPEDTLADIVEEAEEVASEETLIEKMLGYAAQIETII